MRHWSNLAVLSASIELNRHRHGYDGFTLLEVLVAMSIFAVIGLGANQMLRTIIDTHEVIQSNNQAINSMVRVFSMMDRDFSQIVPRQVRDEYGEPLQPLIVGTGKFYIEFSRTGWNNPAQRQRSILQRVAYQLDDGKLSRHFWLVLDRAEDSEAIAQDLLQDVESFRINLLDEEGEGTDVWPDFGSEMVMPLAIEVILETKMLGEIRRVFVLSSLARKIPRTASEQGNAPENGVEVRSDADVP